MLLPFNTHWILKSIAHTPKHERINRERSSFRTWPSHDSRYLQEAQRILWPVFASSYSGPFLLPGFVWDINDGIGDSTGFRLLYVSRQVAWSLGIVDSKFLFPLIGLFNALNGLGAGGQVDSQTSANSNSALYATFAISAFFAGFVFIYDFQSFRRWYVL